MSGRRSTARAAAAPGAAAAAAGAQGASNHGAAPLKNTNGTPGSAANGSSQLASTGKTTITRPVGPPSVPKISAMVKLYRAADDRSRNTQEKGISKRRGANQAAPSLRGAAKATADVKTRGADAAEDENDTENEDKMSLSSMTDEEDTASAEDESDASSNERPVGGTAADAVAKGKGETKCDASKASNGGKNILTKKESNVPPAAIQSKKRKANVDDSKPAKKPAKETSNTIDKRRENDIASRKGGNALPGQGMPRCHQCRGVFSTKPEVLLQCSQVKATTRRGAAAVPKEKDAEQDGSQVGRCVKKYCNKCLHIRYGIELEQVRPGKQDDGYRWVCPFCQDLCNCSTCRRRKGLAPTGLFSETDLAAAGVRCVAELLLNDPKAKGKGAGTTPAKNVQNVLKKPEVRIVQRAKPSRTTSENGGRTKPSKRSKQRKARAGGLDSSDLSSLPSSDLSEVPEVPSPGPPLPPKVLPKRAPKTVLAPQLVASLATSGLSSAQILLRLNVREFVIRFRHLFPGFGFSAAATKADTTRAEKIIESMDDPIGFWLEDEGGMRSVLAALVMTIEKAEYTVGGMGIVLAEGKGRELLGQIRKDVKVGVMAAQTTQGAVQCWETALVLLKMQPDFEARIKKDLEEAYLDTSQAAEESRAKYKIRPEEKASIVASFVELALKCEAIRDDMLQGIDRAKHLNNDIVKNRAQLKRDWEEYKTGMMEKKPPAETLLDPGKPPSKQTVKIRQAEEERIAALSAWEGEMKEKENEYKAQLRLYGTSQYLANTSNRLRFQPAGLDTRGNRYYILSETPNRGYPLNRSELSWSWSYNLIIHGRTPNNDNVPKTAKAAVASLRAASSSANGVDSGSEVEVDMLEGGDREDADQWLRISEPHEIRQIAAWINYEALLIDRKRDSSGPGGEEAREEPSEGSKAKEVAALVEQCQAFAEFLDLRMSEMESGERGVARDAKGRATRTGTMGPRAFLTR